MMKLRKSQLIPLGFLMMRVEARRISAVWPGYGSGVDGTLSMSRVIILLKD